MQALHPQPPAPNAISERAYPLAHGTSLHCRVAGTPGRPVLMFVHGFPEAAWVWDAFLAHFSQAEHGGYRCIAPFLRGYAPSSSPSDATEYRPKHLVRDLSALIALESSALHCMVAHDWGGAVAWNLANQLPQQLERLVILNAPHPGAFLRELQSNAQQQAASQYMHFLCRPDAEALLADDDFRRLFAFFNQPDGTAPHWLTDAMRARYRSVWQQGLSGACNYYRASPLRPPRADDRSIMDLHLPEAALTVAVPTLVLWGMDDPALQPGLLDGLHDWVPDLRVRQLNGASHWLVHEQTSVLLNELQSFIQK